MTHERSKERSRFSLFITYRLIFSSASLLLIRNSLHLYINIYYIGCNRISFDTFRVILSWRRCDLQYSLFSVVCLSSYQVRKHFISMIIRMIEIFIQYMHVQSHLTEINHPSKNIWNNWHYPKMKIRKIVLSFYLTSKKTWAQKSNEVSSFSPNDVLRNGTIVRSILMDANLIGTPFLDRNINVIIKSVKFFLLISSHTKIYDDLICNDFSWFYFNIYYYSSHLLQFF